MPFCCTDKLSRIRKNLREMWSWLVQMVPVVPFLVTSSSSVMPLRTVTRLPYHVCQHTSLDNISSIEDLIIDNATVDVCKSGRVLYTREEKAVCFETPQHIPKLTYPCDVEDRTCNEFGPQFASFCTLAACIGLYAVMFRCTCAHVAQIVLRALITIYVCGCATAALLDQMHEIGYCTARFFYVWLSPAPAVLLTLSVVELPATTETRLGRLGLLGFAEGATRAVVKYLGLAETEMQASMVCLFVASVFMLAWTCGLQCECCCVKCVPDLKVVPCIEEGDSPRRRSSMSTQFYPGWKWIKLGAHAPQMESIWILMLSVAAMAETCIILTLEVNVPRWKYLDSLAAEGIALVVVMIACRVIYHHRVSEKADLVIPIVYSGISAVAAMILIFLTRDENGGPREVLVAAMVKLINLQIMMYVVIDISRSRKTLFRLLVVVPHMFAVCFLQFQPISFLKDIMNTERSTVYIVTTVFQLVQIIALTCAAVWWKKKIDEGPKDSELQNVDDGGTGDIDNPAAELNQESKENEENQEGQDVTEDVDGADENPIWQTRASRPTVN